MKKSISTFIILYVLWVLLTGLAPAELAIGAVVALLLSILIKPNFQLDMTALIKIPRFIFLYLPLFIWKLVLSNLQMAQIVLTPKMPIQPGFVTVTTDLKSDIGKLALANSITLTPGTLSIDVAENKVLIHWVKVEGEDAEAHKKAISADFEKSLGGIF